MCRDAWRREARQPLEQPTGTCLASASAAVADADVGRPVEGAREQEARKEGGSPGEEEESRQHHGLKKHYTSDQRRLR